MNLQSHIRQHTQLGIYLGPRAVVMSPASGSVDTTALNAAIIRAGNGGLVLAPPNQTYIVNSAGGVHPGSNTVTPAVVNLNGSTIQLTGSLISGTIASGTYTAGAGRAIVLSAGHGARFVNSDRLICRKADNTAFTTGAVTSISGDTVTCILDAFDSGASITTGDFITRDDQCLRFDANDSLPITVTNGVFDGNVAARSAVTGYTLFWHTGPLLSFWLKSNAIASFNTFQNAGVGWGLDFEYSPYCKAIGNHFSNIIGSGLAFGGSTVSVDEIAIANSFKNVYQLTNATSPTVTQFGHYPSVGAMTSSTGPVRTIITANVVETCGAYGYSNLNPVDTDVVLTSNLFNGCVMGAWDCNAGFNFVAASNLVTTCGHETNYGATGEITQIRSSTPANASVTGNVLIDSVLSLRLDSSALSVTGNFISTLNKTFPKNFSNVNELAGLMLNYSSVGMNKCSVFGNTIIGPDNAGGANGSGGNGAMYGVYFAKCNYMSFTGNFIYGGWFGMVLANTAFTFCKWNENIVMNTCNTDNAAASSVAVSVSGTFVACQLSNNIIGLDKTGTAVWIGIQVGNAVTFSACQMAHNIIYESPNMGGNAIGVTFGTNTCAGLTFESVHVQMGNAASAGIAAGSAISTGHFLANRVPVGTVNYGAATVAYGAVNSNFTD